MKSFFRKNDYVILSIAAIFLGVFIAIQYSNSSHLKSDVVSNDVLAVEIEKIAKTNSELKTQVAELTKKNASYTESFSNQTSLDSQIKQELSELNIVNGNSSLTGQGVIMNVNDRISEAQMVDLINSIKNIGADGISINGVRISLYQAIDQNVFSVPYNISIVGNSSVLESALNRKGGIVELLKQKKINVSVSKVESITLPKGRTISMQYAKIEEN